MIDPLGIDRFALVGLSLGGMWGAELALLAPERVRALALIDTFTGAEPDKTRQRYFAMLNAVQAAGAIPKPVLDAVVPMFFSAGIETRLPDLPAGFRVRLMGWDNERLLDSVVPVGRMTFGRRDLLDSLAELQMPALVMTGSEDTSRSVAEGGLMAERLGCRFVVLPGAGHISSLKAAESVTDHLRAFLKDALLGDGGETAAG